MTGEPEGADGTAVTAGAPPRFRRRDGSPGPAGARAWDLSLAPSSRVPIRDQIAVQIVAAVRAGVYGAGDRLPSVRALAGRVGVHRNTVRAAYRELAGRGVVVPRPGSGVFVAPVGPPAAGAPLRRFLARERASGRTWSDVAELMGRWREAVGARRVTVVAADEDLRAIWVEELRESLEPVDVTVVGLPLAEARAHPDRLARTVTAAPAGCLAELGPSLPRWTEGVLLRPGPSPRTRRLLFRLPSGSVLTVVSGSAALRRQTRELASALRDGEVAVRGLAPEDAGRRGRLLRVARFVLTDVTCRPAVARVVGERRVLTLRHLSRETGRELARCFGAPRARSGAVRAGDGSPPRRREGGER